MAKSPETAPIYVQRFGDKLAGEMQMDRDAIAKFKAGDRIKVTLHTGRSPSRLRWYWAFLNEVVKATECSPNAESLHEVVKLHTGFVTPVMVKGMTVMVPRSVSFSAMSEQEFADFLQHAERFIGEAYGLTAKEAIPSITITKPRSGLEERTPKATFRPCWQSLTSARQQPRPR